MADIISKNEQMEDTPFEFQNKNNTCNRLLQYSFSIMSYDPKHQVRHLYVTILMVILDLQ